MNTATRCTAEQYRDLISGLSDAFASWKSARPGHERRVEAMRVRRWVDDLSAAYGPRISDRDMAKAERLLNECRAAMDEFDRECKAADANLSRMAFGGEWK